jgi:hypothetical protein
VVDAIFGELNPSGRLSTTAYPLNFTTAYRANMTDMRLRGGPALPGLGLPATGGVTYMHYTDTPTFPFGFGVPPPPPPPPPHALCPPPDLAREAQTKYCLYGAPKNHDHYGLSIFCMDKH